MTEVLSLLLKLFETRKANKMLVLKECAEPLKAKVDELHAHYIEAFNRYRHDILKTGVTADFVKFLEHDLNSALAKRAELGGLLDTFVGLIHKTLDYEEEVFATFLKAIVDYLFLGTDTPTIKLKFFQATGEPIRHAITTQKAYKEILRSIEPPIGRDDGQRERLATVMSDLIGGQQARYQHINSTYARLRVFLLA